MTWGRRPAHLAEVAHRGEQAVDETLITILRHLDDHKRRHHELRRARQLREQILACVTESNS